MNAHVLSSLLVRLGAQGDNVRFTLPDGTELDAVTYSYVQKTKLVEGEEKADGPAILTLNLSPKKSNDASENKTG